MAKQVSIKKTTDKGLTLEERMNALERRFEKVERMLQLDRLPHQKGR